MLKNYSFLASSNWIRYIVLALVAATACAFLANWQNDRRQQRDAEIATIKANYDADPVSVASTLADTSAPLEDTDEWTKVKMHGHYSPDLAVLARNRTSNGQPGFYVIVPFTLDSGTQILINRGWVPTPQSGKANAAEVPQPPEGDVTVTGWLRQTEDGSKDKNPPGMIRAIDTSRVPGLTDPYTQAFVQLQAEDPAGEAGLSPLPKPSLDPGSHLSYTFQWITFGIMILGAIVFTIVREKKTRDSSTDTPTTYVVVDKESIKHGAKEPATRYGTTHHRTQSGEVERARGVKSSVKKREKRKEMRDEDIEDAELGRQGL